MAISRLIIAHFTANPKRPVQMAIDDALDSLRYLDDCIRLFEPPQRFSSPSAPRIIPLFRRHFSHANASRSWRSHTIRSLSLPPRRTHDELFISKGDQKPSNLFNAISCVKCPIRIAVLLDYSSTRATHHVIDALVICRVDEPLLILFYPTKFQIAHINSDFYDMSYPLYEYTPFALGIPCNS